MYRRLGNCTGPTSIGLKELGYYDEVTGVTEQGEGPARGTPAMRRRRGRRAVGRSHPETCCVGSGEWTLRDCGG